MMKIHALVALPVLGLGLAGCTAVPESIDDADEGDVGEAAAIDIAPAGKRIGALRDLLANDAQSGRQSGGHSAAGGVASTTSGISYHGGAVMTRGVNIYLIWYGDWSGNTAPAILTDLVSDIGGSPWFNINTTYGDSSTLLPNTATYAGSATDWYSHGTTLSDAAVRAVVSATIKSYALPADPDGVYFVLTSADVDESSGFCSDYCGWHSHSRISGQDIKYSFVGNAGRCPDSCQAQASGPNGNAGADGMASILAHELAEAVTDPELDAWYDSSGYENADKCAWTFGPTYLVASGVKANMRIGERDYLVQQNWVNSGSGYCAQGHGSTPP